MRIFICVFLIFSITGCHCNKCATQVNSNDIYNSVIVYKTKSDYRNKVPVILSDDKGTIISFPAPSDLMKDSTLRLPTELLNGYVLDNQGINKNSAFTSYTYEEYSGMKFPPDIDELKNRIIDTDPFLEIHDFKSLFEKKDKIEIIKKYITKGDFSKAILIK